MSMNTSNEHLECVLRETLLNLDGLESELRLVRSRVLEHLSGLSGVCSARPTRQESPKDLQ